MNIIDEGAYYEETGKLFPLGVTTRKEAEAVEQLGLTGKCNYKKEWTEEVGDVWVCVIHGQNSKYHNNNNNQEESTMPCLELDPW